MENVFTGKCCALLSVVFFGGAGGGGAYSISLELSEVRLLTEENLRNRKWCNMFV